MLSIRELRENKLIRKYASYPFNTFGFEVRSHLQSSAYEDKEVKSLSRVRLFATPWTVVYQAPPSMGISRQEYWSGLPCPSPSAFFIVQLSHPYMTVGKNNGWFRWTFVGKVMSLLLNMLSRLVITFLPKSKRLLISWLQSPSAVIWESKKIKSITVSTVYPSIFHEVMGPDTMILVF